MDTFSFRLRFVLSPRDAIGFPTPTAELPAIEETASLELKAGDGPATIADSKNLVVLGSGLQSQETAQEVGSRVKSAVMLALAGLRMGADFGDRRPGSFMFRAGLELVEQMTGSRVLNDVHGLMTFQQEPPPRFINVPSVNALRRMQPERFIVALRKALALQCELSSAESLSYELYNASFFEQTARTRFLVLVMAIEALLVPSERRPEAQEHVNDLIRVTDESPVLSKDEKASMRGSLRWLLSDSISHTGRALVQSRLGVREYMGMPAAAFFRHCYDLRSKIVHGKGIRGDERAIGFTAASLETFVAELLAGFRLGFDL